MESKNNFACLILAGEALGLEPPVGFLREYLCKGLNIASDRNVSISLTYGLWSHICKALESTCDNGDPLWCTLNLYRGTILETVLNGTLTRKHRDWKPFIEDLSRLTYVYAAEDCSEELGFSPEVAELIYKEVQ